MHDFGYVEAKIKEEDVKIFENLTNKICKKRDFYYDMPNEIKGNVSPDLHLTLCYGYKNPVKINQSKFSEILKSIKLKTLKLGKLILLPGYQSKYQILIINVLDENKQIEKVYNQFQSQTKNKGQIKFRPHLTLAYVKPDFKLESKLNFPKEVKISAVKTYI